MTMELLAALDRIAELERSKISLLCMVRMIRRHIHNLDYLDANEVVHLSDLLDRAEVMQ